MAERDRSGQINFIFTAAQKKALQRAAKVANMEVTEYVRDVLAMIVPGFPRDERPRGNPNIKDLRKKSTPRD